LRREGGLCHNCADAASEAPHQRIPRCLGCLRTDVPGEFHHLASERQHATFGLRLCLNCHAILTARQVTAWRPSWKTGKHRPRCMAQGTLDLIWLWLRRSHAAWALGQLAKLCAQVGWSLFEALGLVGWAGWQAT
jgi:hypothetical protein